ncbi:alkane 1-monooxygenase [Limimaricola cinnabarinus]|uniref:alkane 1-monooxygenase n=1 Tax=Limimaricola cinnabarinus TaxID=1125964 RepID=UPI0024916A4D|nr:alkane 1-monooxygenase [Limimaricola cinnabarinus]
MPLAFATATLLPLPLIAAAMLWGGAWAFAAPLALALLTAALDEIGARLAPPRPGAEFPASAALTLAIGLSHFALLGGAVWALSGGWLTLGEKAGLFAAAGLWLGQVSNANAHELIHAPARGPRRLGVAVYVSLLFGHHASAHPLVHHVRVATRDDPATARRGEGFWRYAPRAWRGGFREGLRMESARRRGHPRWRHPYLHYAGGAALALGLSALLAGWRGVAAHLALAGFAQLQLLLSDYVQHYGLERARGPDGRIEPVGARHSWNSPHPVSSWMMLNAPRHSDHHARPARPYPALDLPEAAPMLPRSLPVMACLALWPRFWRRVMDPRVAAWRATGREGLAARAAE